MDFYARPRFGEIGPTPCTDGLGDIKEHEVCGVTSDQFPQWWNREYDWETGETHVLVPDELPKDWWAKIFDVPDEHVRIGRMQVVFDRSKAVEVFRTRNRFPR